MIKNYFKIAYRNLIKNKVYSIINILGLASGTAVAMLIALWIWDEVTFNNYHSNHNHLAQVMSTSFNDKNEQATGAAVAMPLGNELRTKYAGDFKDVSMASWNYGHTLAAGEKKITGNGMYVESKFPSMFSLRMLAGDGTALDDPSSVLLSASIAKSLFGSTDAMNRTVRIDNTDDFRVAGIFEDLPQNTSLYTVKLLLPWKKYITAPWLINSQSSWYNHSFQAFVQVHEPGNIGKISDKVKNIAMAHKNAATEGKEELLLHPMHKWHLYNEFKNGKAAAGRIKFVGCLRLLAYSYY